MVASPRGASGSLTTRPAMAYSLPTPPITGQPKTARRPPRGGSPRRALEMAAVSGLPVLPQAERLPSAERGRPRTDTLDMPVPQPPTIVTASFKPGKTSRPGTPPPCDFASPAVHTPSAELICARQELQLLRAERESLLREVDQLKEGLSGAKADAAAARRGANTIALVLQQKEAELAQLRAVIPQGRRNSVGAASRRGSCAGPEGGRQPCSRRPSVSEAVPGVASTPTSAHGVASPSIDENDAAHITSERVFHELAGALTTRAARSADVGGRLMARVLGVVEMSGAWRYIAATPVRGNAGGDGVGADDGNGLDGNSETAGVTLQARGFATMKAREEAAGHEVLLPLCVSVRAQLPTLMRCRQAALFLSASKVPSPRTIQHKSVGQPQ